MGHRFAALAFTAGVRAIQSARGSRDGYRNMDQGEDYNHRLGSREAEFIAARDSFYMASVSETGWPYVQHRGGPAGFMRVLDERTIGFADFSGNRQYISTGNFSNDDRVALIFVDYPNRRRLKLLGRVRIVDGEETDTLSRLEVDDYRARVERGFLIRVEAFDWNCPQHITPRFSEAEVEALMQPLREENRRLRALQSDSSTSAPDVLGDGPLPLVISAVRQLTPRVRAYELRDPEGRELPEVHAGSHLQVPVRLDNGQQVLRHYSICSNPARRDVYEIAVLREDAGEGGSKALHEGYRLGMTLRCAHPRNDFSLRDGAGSAFLIAGGIGITPIKAMAQALAARGTDLQLHYAGRARDDMAFLDRLEREFGDRLRVYAAADGDRIDVDDVLRQASAGAGIYVCGPGRLIEAVTRSARSLGIDPERIRYERFAAPDLSDARPVRLELRRSGLVIDVDTGTSLLDAMLAEGIDAPHSCRVGNCRSCAVKVLEGEAEHHDMVLSSEERSAQGLMCPCVSRARGDHLVLDV